METVTTVILFMVFISIFHCDGEAPSLPFFCIGKFFSSFQFGDLGMYIFGTSVRRTSRSVFGRPTGNDVSGH